MTKNLRNLSAFLLFSTLIFGWSGCSPTPRLTNFLEAQKIPAPEGSPTPSTCEVKACLRIKWAPPAEPVTGYIIHYGETSGTYDSEMVVGNVTEALLSGLLQGQNYCVVVTAYTGTFGASDFVQSGYSNSICATTVSGSSFANLNPEEKSRLEGGETVSTLSYAEGSSWPIVEAKQLTSDLSPLEIAAVFSDYDKHQSIFSGLRMSKPRNGNGLALRKEVEYERYIHPRYKNLEYTLGYSIKQNKANQSIRITWSMVEGKFVKGWEGFIDIESKGRGSLVTFTQTVAPDFRNAQVLGKFYADMVLHNFAELVSQVHDLKQYSPDHLDYIKSQLQKVLGNP